MNGGDRSDADLLTAYASGVKGMAEADSAFADIVARHGGMVYHTCVRVLGEQATAEDASQAAFVVLAQKAKSVRGDLGAYLHGVALNVARRARDAEQLRKKREREAVMASETRESDQEVRVARWAEIRPNLDEAIEHLPRMQRAAVVMHLLEGRTQEDTARRLGISRGALASYVRRATEKLRARLARKATGLSVAVLGGFLAERSAEAACPAFLTAAAGKLAASGLAGAGVGVGAATAALSSNVTLLAKGAIKMMFWAKVKVVAAVLGTAAVVGAGVPATVHAVRAGEKVEPVKEPVPAAAAKAEVLKFRRLEVKPPMRMRTVRMRTVKPDFFACKSTDDMMALPFRYEGEMPAYVGAEAKFRKAWWTRRKLDFKKEMVLAFFTGAHADGSDASLRIERVLSTGAEVQVRVRFTPGMHDDKGSHYDLVACPRRDLPVVFYENGKRVAEVLPFRRLQVMLPFGLRSAKRQCAVAKSEQQLLTGVGHYYERVLSPKYWQLQRGVIAPKHDTGSDPPAGSPAAKMHAARKAWAASLGIDFGKEMVLGALKGIAPKTSDARWTITTVRVVADELRVDLRLFEGMTEGGCCYPYDLVACPRRDLPVVFYENGKEVARVPFKPAGDKELEAFLGKVRYAEAVVAGKVTYVCEEGTDDDPRSVLVQDILVTPEETFCGELAREFPKKSIGLSSGNLIKGAKRFPVAKGDKIIACWVGKGRIFPAVIKWSPAREKAVKFALAPGWRRTTTSFLCPWHPIFTVKSEDLGTCKHCRKETPSGGMQFCRVCAPMLGKCMNAGCSRTGGPATRGVALQLDTYSPNARITWSVRGMEDAKANRVRIRPGQARALWLTVDNKAPAGKVPEIQIPAGGKRLDCCYTIFFLVDGPGQAGPRIVLPVDGGARATLQAPRPLTGSATGKLTLRTRDAAGRPVFDKPGTYTVRAVAGRLASNPVTVVVSGKTSPAGNQAGTR